MKQILLKLFRNFVNGIIIITPLTITLYLIYLAYQFFADMIQLGTQWWWFLLIPAAITLLGYLGSKYLIGRFIEYFEKGIVKLPLIKILYSSIKDLLSAFVGDKRKFNKAVLVAFDGDSLYKPGFITQEDMSIIGMSEFVAVYFPHSYNFSGNLFLCPSNKVKPIEVNGSDYMKFIVSGGVTSLDSAQPTENNTL
jgi:uncharacterized membrane protein